MNRVLVIFGTRPEAIKMCPVVKEMRSRGIGCKVCLTGQHTDMLYEVMGAFGVACDYKLSVMKHGASLAELNSALLTAVDGVIAAECPDLVLVHGDTASAYAASLAAFYRKIPVGHVEAGLRSGDLLSPFPEELYRRAISIISSIDFAPTPNAIKNLIREGKRPEHIYLTGNTVIDAVCQTVRSDFSHEVLDFAQGARLVLLTAHRRENIGDPMRSAFSAIRRVAEERKDVRIVYPLHKNGEVRKIAEEELSGCKRIMLSEPIGVVDFHNVMKRAYLVLTDSGGIQEEAPALGVPVLVLRNTTERQEGVISGGIKLIGTVEESVYREFTRLLDDPFEYERMARAKNPFGEGGASRLIADIISSL